MELVILTFYVDNRLLPPPNWSDKPLFINSLRSKVKPDNIKKTFTGHKKKLCVKSPIYQLAVGVPEKLCTDPFVQCSNNTLAQATMFRASIQISLCFFVSISLLFHISDISENPLFLHL